MQGRPPNIHSPLHANTSSKNVLVRPPHCFHASDPRTSDPLPTPTFHGISISPSPSQSSDEPPFNSINSINIHCSVISVSTQQLICARAEDAVPAVVQSLACRARVAYLVACEAQQQIEKTSLRFEPSPTPQSPPRSPARSLPSSNPQALLPQSGAQSSHSFLSLPINLPMQAHQLLLPHQHYPRKQEQRTTTPPSSAPKEGAKGGKGGGEAALEEGYGGS